MPSRLRTVEGLAALMFVLVTFAGAGYPAEPRSKPAQAKPAATKTEPPPEANTLTRGGKRAVEVGVEPQASARVCEITQEARRFDGHAGMVLTVAVSPDGRRALSGGVDATMRLWDLQLGRELRRFDGPGDWVVGVAFSPDGRRALSSNHSDKSVILWDVESGAQLRRFEHPESVLGVAFSPGGRYALSGCFDSALRLWNVETGEEVRRFQSTDPFAVRAVALSPDGRYALSGNLNDTALSVVRMWDLQTGAESRCFRGHSHWIASVAFSPNGRYALSGSWDKTMRHWAVGSGQELRRFEHVDKVEPVDFSPDGRRALSGCFDGIVRLWELETGKDLAQFKGHRGAVKCLAFSPDGCSLVSGGEDGTIRLWKLPEKLMGGKGVTGAVSGRERPQDPVIEGRARAPQPPTPPEPPPAIEPKDFDAEKKALEGTWRVVGCEQGGKPVEQFALSQFTFKAGRVTVTEQSGIAEYHCTLDTAKRPKQLVLAAPISPGEKKRLRVAYALDGDRLVICFDTRPGVSAPNVLETKAGDDRFLATLKRLPRPVADEGVGRGARPGTAELVRRIEWPGIHVCHTAFSPDGRLYLGGGDSGTLRVWDVATGQQLHELPSPLGLFTPDGKHVLGHSEKTICLFDLTSGKEVRRWEPSEAVVGLAIAPEGKRFVSGHADNLLRLWDLAGDKELRGFEYPAEPGEDRGPLGGSQEGYSALPAVFSPDGKQIVSASADKRIRVWDADTGKCLRVLETFKNVGRLADHHLILDASFLPGGRQIAGHVWGTEKTLVVWDAATGQELRRLDLGADHHKDLAISPDGRWFITAHEDRTVRLRDLTTGEEIHRFELADVYVPRGLAFSPDGRYAAAGSHRGWVYLWRLPKGPEKVSERIPDREHHAVPEGGVSPPHTPKGKLSDIDLKPEANQKLAGQIGRPPFLQQIVRVAWDGEQFEPCFLGRRGIEEKDLGRIMRDEETWEQEYEKEHMDGKGMGKPAPRGQPVRRVVRAPAYCKGLAFHPDGRTAFSEGYGSNRDMRLAFWKETGQIAPVVDLRLSEQYPKTEEARNAQERQGLFWFFAGPLAFDKSGTCYFSPGPVGPGNGIYRVNSEAVRKDRPLVATTYDDASNDCTHQRLRFRRCEQC
jgi:uncharacterized protein (TIGR03067 family)